jgi:hypothetical protein
VTEEELFVWELLKGKQRNNLPTKLTIMHAHARVHAARPQIFFHEKVKSARNTKILPPEKYPLYGIIFTKTTKILPPEKYPLYGSYVKP